MIRLCRRLILMIRCVSWRCRRRSSCVLVLNRRRDLRVCVRRFLIWRRCLRVDRRVRLVMNLESVCSRVLKVFRVKRIVIRLSVRRFCLSIRRVMCRCMVLSCLMSVLCLVSCWKGRRVLWLVVR